MRILFTGILTFLLYTSLNAQFTAAIQYESNTSSDWDAAIQSGFGDSETVLDNSVSINLGYWIKVLKDYRWEMIPELSYGLGSKEIGANNQYKWNRFELVINNHLYLFDIESDCNCPTFSKDGPAFTKGIFINVAPSYAFNSFSSTFLGPSELIISEGSSSVFFGKIGFGFDIGAGDLLTITPHFNLVVRPTVTWENLGTETGLTNVESTVTQREFGLRLNFRFDYVRGQNRFRR